MSKPSDLSVDMREVMKDVAAAQARVIDERKSLPTIEELCTSTPLYQPIATKNGEFLAELRARDTQYDGYCLHCEREVTFKAVRQSVTTGTPETVFMDATFPLQVKCLRQGHLNIFYFRYFGGILMKIGQFPSIADLSGAELRKYRPLLRDGYFEELTRANGLISHGIGIGSFVYLRRIFEKLINDHRDQLRANGNPLDNFDTLRMEDKIEALKTVLPPALVKNRATYGILSAGIHALNEEQCKRYFPVVKAAIMQILDQDFQARERDRVAQELEAEIAKISGEIKSSGTS